jgi:phosphatidate cytidylyltransferase
LSNLKTRIITGALFGATLIAGISINQYTFFIVFVLVIIGGLWEFYFIFKKNGIYPQVWPGILMSIIIFIGTYYINTGNADSKILLWVMPVIFYLVIAELFRKKKDPFINIAISVLAVIYIAIPFSLFWFLAFWENIYQYNHHLILAFFITLWTYDTFAYLLGLVFGKHKLFERISPKKTWEGAIAGYIMSLVAAWLISLFYVDLSLRQWFIFASLIAVFGTLGDLTESMLKRSFDLKDSGNILPGHGGILDRFDAVLLAIPAIFIYLQFI